MDDLISRQAAVDAIYENEFSNWCDKDEVSTILNDLPAAEPEIIRCRECKWYGTKFCSLDRWTNEIIIRKAKDDDFCSHAERRSDE